MRQVHLTATFRLKPDALARFKAVADRLIASVQEGEPDTLTYLWFFSDDERTCVVRELYRSPEALLRHVERAEPLLGELFALANLSLEVCGNVSPALREALAPFPHTVNTFHGGVDRATT